MCYHNEDAYLVGGDAIDADHVSHATGILLIAGVIQTLSHWHSKCVRLHGGGGVGDLALRSSRRALDHSYKWTALFDTVYILLIVDKQDGPQHNEALIVP